MLYFESIYNYSTPSTGIFLVHLQLFYSSHPALVYFQFICNYSTPATGYFQSICNYSISSTLHWYISSPTAIIQHWYISSPSAIFLFQPPCTGIFLVHLQLFCTGIFLVHLQLFYSSHPALVYFQSICSYSIPATMHWYISSPSAIIKHWYISSPYPIIQHWYLLCYILSSSVTTMHALVYFYRSSEIILFQPICQLADQEPIKSRFGTRSGPTFTVPGFLFILQNRTTV